MYATYVAGSTTLKWACQKKVSNPEPLSRISLRTSSALSVE